MRLKKIINKQRARRSFRVRAKVRGSAERPRLCVERSLKHMCLQLIDDSAGKTLVSASTREKELRSSFTNGGNCQAAQKLGKILAERAITAGIKSACLDRGSCKYHGRLAAMANAAREAGLAF